MILDSFRVFAIDSSCLLLATIASTVWLFCLVSPAFGISVSTPSALASDASCVRLSNIRPWPDYAKRYLRSASSSWLRSGQPFIPELKSSGFSGSFYKFFRQAALQIPSTLDLSNSVASRPSPFAPDNRAMSVSLIGLLAMQYVQ
jgi:hypothetical protein